jgi:siderophore synthetase component
MGKAAGWNIVASDVKIMPLSRFILQGSLYAADHSGLKKQPLTLSFMLEFISKELSASGSEALEQLSLELMSQFQHTADNLEQQFDRDQHMLKMALKHDVSGVMDYSSQFSNRAPSTFFEQWATQGHPYHPCNKTKLGMSDEDVRRYSPEFAHTVPVVICAIDKTLAATEMESDELEYMSWFQSHYPEVVEAWQTALLERYLDPDLYLPIPVHPWQAKHRFEILFHAEIEKQQIVILDSVTLNMTPSLSFRTLCPLDNQKHHIKLPVAVQTTSALRTVSPGSIHNSPKISRIIRQIVKKEASFSGRLRVMYDSVGIRMNAKNPEIAKHFSALFRDNPESLCQKEETVLVTAALFQRSAISGSPLIAELIEAATDGSETAILSYFESLVDIVLTPYLNLYFKYGIACEAHQQNTLFVFKDNKPVSTVLRDFGGIRVHLPSLESAGFEFKAFNGSAIATDNQVKARNKLIHTVYQCQLGEMILSLSEHYDIETQAFWSIVNEKTQDIISSLKPLCRDATYWHEEKMALCQNAWPMKALLSMRLKDEYASDIYHMTMNPLAEFNGARRHEKAVA